MTKLEQLTYSLIAVLVRYHDSQNSKEAIFSEYDNHLRWQKCIPFATELLKQKESHIYAKLDEIIKAATKNYQQRTEFLNFISHEILFLRQQLHRSAHYEPLDFEKFRQQIYLLLKDFIKLLETTKNSQYTVTASPLGIEKETIIKISGLVNDKLFGNTYCNSAICLIEEVMDRLNLKCGKESDESLKRAALGLCTEHHNALLVKAYTNKLLLTTELETQQKKNEEIWLLTEETEQERNKDLIDKNNQLQLSIESQQQELINAHKLISELTKQNASLKEENVAIKNSVATYRSLPGSQPSLLGNSWNLNRLGVFATQQQGTSEAKRTTDEDKLAFD